MCLTRCSGAGLRATDIALAKLSYGGYLVLPCHQFQVTHLVAVPLSFVRMSCCTVQHCGTLPIRVRRTQPDCSSVLPLCESIPAIGESRVQCGIHHHATHQCRDEVVGLATGLLHSLSRRSPWVLNPQHHHRIHATYPNQTTTSSVGMPTPGGLPVLTR